MKIILFNDLLNPIKVNKVEYYKLNEETNDKIQVGKESQATHVGVYYNNKQGYECKNIITNEPDDFSVNFEIFNTDKEIVDWYIEKAKLDIPIIRKRNN